MRNCILSIVVVLVMFLSFGSVSFASDLLMSAGSFELTKHIDEKDDSINDNTEASNIQKYLCNVNDDYFLQLNCFVKQTDICQYCKKGEPIPMEDEGILVCNQCFRIIPYLLENDKPSYRNGQR